MEERIVFKILLKQHCEKIFTQRIAATQQAMDNAQAAANQEGKSSAGDKYETARAMSHLEKDMHARQLLANQRDLLALGSINVQTIYTSVRPGSFVQTETFSFFIAAGLGKQEVDGKTIVFLSPVSPLAQQMMHKKAGDEFDFKGRNSIVEVY
jgi:transcription elongation GreA/GreB family factor